MRGIKFKFIYHGINYSSKNNDKPVFKKVYSLDQLITKPLRELCDIHDNSMLIAKCQFTGLTDKNGVDIYEGDIVTAQVKERTISECGEYNIQTGKYISSNLSVEYVDHMTHTGYKFYGVDRRFNAKVTKSFIVNNKIKVIGNIHQHSELLK